MGTYLWNLLEWGSQGLNAIFLAGNPNMTVSARCYMNSARPGWSVAYRVINKLFFWQENHCKQSYEEDVRFAKSILPTPTGPYCPPGVDPDNQ